MREKDFNKIEEKRNIWINAHFYENVEKWNKFKVKNMDGYHNHYLKKDILLLADVCEKSLLARD